MEHELRKKVLGEMDMKKPYDYLKEQIRELVKGKIIEIDVAEALDLPEDLGIKLQFSLKNGSMNSSEKSVLEVLYSKCIEYGEPMDQELERVLELKRLMAFMEMRLGAVMDAEIAPSVDPLESYVLVTYREVFEEPLTFKSCLEKANEVLNLYLLAVV